MAIRNYGPRPRREEGPLINERCLRFRDVRVIDSKGEQLGILQTHKALSMARDEGLDLVVVAPNAQPPVVRIVDYGKYKYELNKREKENKRKSQEVKGVKLRPSTAEHDINVLVKHSLKFLEEGHKVKVTCQFRARELAHPEIGERKVLRLAELLEEIAVIERRPILEGRQMIMILAPKPATVGKKNAKDQNEQNGSQAVQDQRDRQDLETQVMQQPPVQPQEQGSSATA